MLSRVADSLYWMSRNIERAENNARVLGVQLIQMLEASSEETLARHDWETVLEICGSNTQFNELYPNMSTNHLIEYLAFSENNANSILNCIRYARENARTTRDIIPNDLFEVWNNLYLDTQEMNIREGSLRDVKTFLERVKVASLTSQGIVDSMMTRGVPYRFFNIAKWLERAEKTARILNILNDRSAADLNKADGTNYYYWRSALQLVNGYEEYLKKYPPRMNEKDVLTFMISDYAFPRSIQYCMDHIRESIISLEGGKVSHYSWRIYAALDSLIDEFDEHKIRSLKENGISAFLDDFQNRCNDISQIFSETYYLVDPAGVP
ncbi:alpha-E domain-containing protein [Jeotgalibacillus sp. R-1-5s-1]|uniref:alpha-E domain-containing protein n=1 Tax=Jeotgalibacillus sp. R-1-5s-1 TaxID=2555897 RepID=UPI00106C9446|nr:alpha-E domain-containing protein [Jeotgalibacillus sp. R-1-5s-1]TFD92850.1 alpha-E domain-containing protein [Jeotgalibacillus sp. R-1-5s-1]